MKVKFVSVALCLSLLAFLPGCRMRTSDPRPTIPLVERVINDVQSREHQFLLGYDPRDPRGDIVLLDSPERCFFFSECLVTADDKDNVDGSTAPDLLPDFAGERITSVIDLLYPSYASFLAADNAPALREVTVRAALSAVDTACCLGPFDHEKRSVKPSAKLLVITSPYMAAYGGFDVDTLFRSLTGNSPVLNIPEVMMERVMDKRDGAVSIGILTDSLTASSGVYQSIFAELASRRGEGYSSVHALYLPAEAASDSLSLSAAGMQPDALKMILDQYSRSGKTQALTTLYVDDRRVSLDSLQASDARILSHPSEENAFYRKMLAKDFEMTDGARVVTDACYQYLRDNNLFTHNISYPVAAAFITSPESNEYMLMDFDPHALTLEMLEKMQEIAPVTYKLYVQDQSHARGN